MLVALWSCRFAHRLQATEHCGDLAIASLVQLRMVNSDDLNMLCLQLAEDGWHVGLFAFDA